MLGGPDSAIKLWDVATVKNTTTLRIADRVISAAAFSPDSKILVTGDNGVKLWEVATGKELATLKGSWAPLVFSPDGKTLATGGVKLWEVATGKELATLQGSRKPLVFSPEGKTLATGSEDNTIKLWDVATGKELAMLKGHTDAERITKLVNDLGSDSFKEREQASKGLDAIGTPALEALRQAYKSEDIEVRQRAEDLVKKIERRIENARILSLAYSSDGKTLASGSADKTIKLWDMAGR